MILSGPRNWWLLLTLYITWLSVVIYFFAGCLYCYLLSIIMPPSHRAEALSDDARLTSVWRLSLSRIRPTLRTERPRKTKTGTDVAHVTRDSDTTFKSKCQRSTCRGGGILWRPPSQLVYAYFKFFIFIHLCIFKKFCYHCYWWIKIYTATAVWNKLSLLGL